jgi:OOP family OmpA-OmpF porin
MIKKATMLILVASGFTLALPRPGSATFLEDLMASFRVGPTQREAMATQAAGDANRQALVEGYKQMATGQFNEGNYAAADLFYRKAIDAANGRDVGPEDPANWSWANESDRAQVASTRQQVMQWVAANRQRDGATAARLQLNYDCWLEEMTEAEYGDADACKPVIPAAVAQTPPPAPVQQTATCASNPDGLDDRGNPCRTASIAFAFDRYDLLNQAENGDRADTIQSQQAALDLIIRQARAIRPARIDLIGRADTVGPEDYNWGLSQCRARSVEAELRKRGLPAEIQTQVIPLGKTRPIVQTGDGIREPANRVVSVAYLKDKAAPPAETPAPTPAKDLFGCGTPKHPFPPAPQRMSETNKTVPQQQAATAPAKPKS